MTQTPGYADPSDNPAPRTPRSTFWTTWSKPTILIAWLIIIGGVGLRLRPYQVNRSLWRDEASISFNIVTKNFHDLLFERLDYNQAAPVGFLAVEKAMVLLLGTGERALRLFPLIAAIVSMPLFYLVARRVLGVRGTLAALLMFALSQPLIYYAAEVKQFGVDVMWTLAILWLALRIAQDGRKMLDLVLLCVIGFIAVWFSHPAIFVLAGVGLALFVDAFRGGAKSAVGALVAAGATWVMAFGVNWYVFLRMVSQHDYLKHYWHDRVKAFPPAPTSLKNLEWHISTFFDTFTYPVGLPAAGLAAGACVIGAIWLWRENRRVLAILGLPVVFAILATLAQQYPFQGRMVLFLVPALVILIAGGVAAVWNGAGPWRLPAGLVILVLLLIHPVHEGVSKFFQSPLGEDFRPVLDEIIPQVQPGDTVYLYEGSIRAFHYYSNANPSRYGLPEGAQLIEGAPEGQPWNVYQAELDKLRGQERVWFLFTHVYEWGGVDERKLYLHMLDQMGTQVTKVEMYGGKSWGYLYDLSEPAKP